MKRNHLKKFFIICCLAAAVATLLAVSKPLTQEASSFQDKNPMSHQSESQTNEQPLSTLPSYQYPIAQFRAEEFYFQTHLDFPVSVLTNSEQYTESITHNHGTLDLTLIDQGDTAIYIFQVSSMVKHQCESDAARACQAATAKGDIAEIQIVLPRRKLTTGAYPLRGDGLTQGNDAIVYSRQLYSDPSHGQLGCQVWGGGTLKVTRAAYDVNGKLEYLDANVTRECSRTAPLPDILPQDALLHTVVENIRNYTYHASWRCRLTLQP